MNEKDRAQMTGILWDRIERHYIEGNRALSRLEDVIADVDQTSDPKELGRTLAVEINRLRELALLAITIISDPAVVQCQIDRLTAPNDNREEWLGEFVAARKLPQWSHD